MFVGARSGYGSGGTQQSGAKRYVAGDAEVAVILVKLVKKATARTKAAEA